METEELCFGVQLFLDTQKTHSSARNPKVKEEIRGLNSWSHTTF